MITADKAETFVVTFHNSAMSDGFSDALDSTDTHRITVDKMPNGSIPLTVSGGARKPWQSCISIISPSLSSVANSVCVYVLDVQGNSLGEPVSWCSRTWPTMKLIWPPGTRYGVC